MLTKSNSVPNFLFEVPKKKQYTLKLNNIPKIIPYSEFLKKNPNATKSERRTAIKNFYDMLLEK
jgi:hypothetical protein